MFTLLNPLLLWGAAAVAAPILIHLLLRQRPRPRPWAAMRWLLAAMQAAQRRYKLTNLLLLLLRCLVVAALALALSRPSLAGFGRGGRLVVVVDISASMGARGGGGSALREAIQGFEEAAIAHDTAALITVGERVQLRSEGDAANLRRALRSVEAVPLPGGLERAATGEPAQDLVALLGRDDDVVLVSDFLQDDGRRLEALLRDRVRGVRRWRVGRAGANALFTDLIGVGDLVPHLPGALAVAVEGAGERAMLAIDEGLPLPVRLVSSAGRARITLPPLEPGRHHVRIELEDPGLTYDDTLELDVVARPTVVVYRVEETLSHLGAALLAAGQRLDVKHYDPVELANQPLPSGGLVALREPVPDAAALARWVRGGGVLWASWDLLQRDQDLTPLVAGMAVGREPRPGGLVQAGVSDLDPNLRRAQVTGVPAVSLPDDGEVLLRAGDEVLVSAVPAGRGWVVVESVPLEEEELVVNLGAFPLWARRVAREYTGRLVEPAVWQAGTPAPEATVLRRHGDELSFAAGEELLVPPGLWRTGEAGEERQVVILPNRAEGDLHGLPVEGASDRLADALPNERGADWGLPLLILVLALMMVEGGVAAWAGRAYGR